MNNKHTAELVVHVGIAKTGSTAIQKYMYLNCDELASHDVYYADTYSPQTSSPNRNPGDYAHHLYSHKWGGWINLQRFPITPDKAWETLGESIRIKGGRHIISSERFGAVLPRPAGEGMLKYIKEVAHPARVKIIIYVRRQDDLAESHFREILKHNTITVDEYLSKLPSLLYLGRTITVAANILGEENIIVRVYERDRLFGGDSVSDFLNTCNIPIVSAVQKDTVANLSLDTLASTVLSDPDLVERLKSKPEKTNALRNFFRRNSFPDSNRYVIFDGEKREHIMKVFEKENEIVARFLSKEDADAFLSRGKRDLNALPHDFSLFKYKELVALINAISA